MEEHVPSSFSSISPIDGRYASVTKSLRPYFSEFGIVKYRIWIEAEWLRKLLTLEDCFSLNEKVSSLDDDFLKKLKNVSAQEAYAVKKIEHITNHDMKAVEYFIKEKIDESDSTFLKSVKELTHYGCTSEDINNLAHALTIKDSLTGIVRPHIIKVIKLFATLGDEFSDTPMLGLTHGQPATPTTFGKEMALYAQRLLDQINYFDKIPIVGKFNGAVGNFNALLTASPNVPWREVSKSFVESFGLTYQPYSTQIENHDHLANLFNALAVFQTILIGACQDIWTYISRGRLRLRTVEKEVGSSTMPHKVNPIDFENAEGNFGLSNALLKFLSQKLPISRMQRDLSDSTVLRNIGVAFAYCLIGLSSLEKGLNKIIPDIKYLEEELNSHWEVLAEPIQTVLREQGVENAYELLKSATRGSNSLTKEKFTQLIDSVLSQHVQDANVLQRLRILTPTSYIGAAPELTKEIVDRVNQLH